MKVPVGKTIAAVCGLQTAYGIWVSWPVWVAMWREGLVNAAGAQPERQAAIMGLFMPASGVWLLLIPAIAGIVQAKRMKRARWTAASGQTPR